MIWNHVVCTISSQKLLQYVGQSVTETEWPMAMILGITLQEAHSIYSELVCSVALCVCNDPCCYPDLHL